MLNVKTVFHLLALTLLKVSKCDIIVYNIESHRIEIEFEDIPSKFGETIPPEGLTGLVVYSNPPEACDNIEKPPVWSNYTGKWIVLIRRYECEFEQKIRNAQKAGYDAAIVHNVNSSASKSMAADNPYGIHIPSVFIGAESGLLIKNNYLYNSGYFILITDDVPFNFTSQLLIIFSVLIGFCFFVMIFFLIVNYFKERRRQRRYCLPKPCLKEITIHRFKKCDPYDICAICLEEYVENDKLRVLPCSHAYHSKCVDPWLTKKRRVCPVCKRKVLTSGEVVTDSDSDTEDETAPLVRSAGNPSYGGTFTRPVENSSSRGVPSTDSGSGIISNSGSTSSETDSIHSVSFSGAVRREFYSTVRNLLHIHSINNSEEYTTSNSTRGNRQPHRNDAERS